MIGICEKGKNNRGPAVDALILEAGGKIGTAWCGWTQVVAHKRCGCPFAGGMAMSWFVRSRLITSGFLPGDLGSVWNKYMNRIGHVLAFEQVLPSGKFVVTIEGNTNAVGSREGSCVCRLTRPVRQIYSFARWWK